MNRIRRAPLPPSNGPHISPGWGFPPVATVSVPMHPVSWLSVSFELDFPTFCDSDPNKRSDRHTLPTPPPVAAVRAAGGLRPAPERQAVPLHLHPPGVGQRRVGLRPGPWERDVYCHCHCCRPKRCLVLIMIFDLPMSCVMFLHLYVK